jgi:molybdopterin-containing oxidoreductase family membrane subunit
LKDKIKHFRIAAAEVAKGGRLYYAWVSFLLLIIAVGIYAYTIQARNGFIVTGLRDQNSWGFYISNFTFLVGVAAAAVLMVLPAYLYHFKPIKEIAFLGEMMAITAICMCIMFVMADVGHPERVWHMLPFIGRPNFPSSMLVWDVIVLNGYLVLNAVIFFYVLYKIYEGEDYSSIIPLIIISIPWAVSIHTVTAFLYNGLTARPFWNASVLAPRFLASAFCSGPALMILVFQIVRRMTTTNVENSAILKMAELIAYTMGVNIFLLGCEVFKEVYTDNVHLAPLTYLYVGLHGYSNLTPWIWLATAFNTASFFIFMLGRSMKGLTLINIACGMTIIGVYIEKGFGLIIPGFVPDPLGEIYEYVPTSVELMVALGIWAAGALLYTLLIKFTLPIYNGKLRYKK